MVQIKKFYDYDQALEQAWQDFTRDKACPVYCDYRWRRVIEELYGRTVVDWVVYDDQGAIKGFCRGYHDQFHFCTTRHGIYAEDPEVQGALYEAIESYIDKMHLISALLTSGNRNDFPQNVDVFEKHTLWLPLLYQDEEDMWASVPKKTRNMVRKAEKSGLQVVHGWDYFDAFYTLYSRHSEDKGLIMRPRAYFEMLHEIFGSALDLFVIQHEGAVKAGMLFLRGEGPVTYMNNASDRDVAQLGGNNLLMWEAMKHFRSEGVSVIDLGESRLNSPVYKFKERLSKNIEARMVYYVREEKGPLTKLGLHRVQSLARRLRGEAYTLRVV